MNRKPSANDAFFLQVERPAAPMHVATLARFEVPEGRNKRYIRELIDAARSHEVSAAPFTHRLARNALGRVLPEWEREEDIDLDYHFRHSALPQPGGERELAVLISRLHSIPLDRSRPLWECHVIEGLKGGGFAIYAKMHHALVDGMAGVALMQRMLAKAPEPEAFVPFWAMKPRKPGADKSGQREAMQGFISQFGAQLAGIGRVSSALMQQLRGARGKQLSQLVAPYSAPDCLLNGPIGPQRRVAVQRFDLAALQELAKAAGGTLNDILLAICAGALRGYLAELEALPDEPLVAQVPVSVRARDEDGGNAISLLLANLGTHLADPGDRFALIKASMDDGKALLAQMSREEITRYSALLMAPFAVGQMAGIGNRRRKPMFNLIISNVPGPKEPLYLNEAPMTDCHPVSLIFEGQALNITLFSYAGTLSVVYTGCRRTLPHMQHLLGHADAACAELEEHFGA